MNAISNINNPDIANMQEEDLPLPSFIDVFGENSLLNPNKKRKKSALGGLGSKIDGSMSGEETTGRWTPDEHRLFLEGIMLYGKDWKKMQPLIKTRTLVQIRTHAQKVFKKIGLKKIGNGSAGGNGGMMNRTGSRGRGMKVILPSLLL